MWFQGGGFLGAVTTLLLIGSVLGGCAGTPQQGPASATTDATPLPSTTAPTASPSPDPVRVSGPIYPDLTSAPVGAWVTIYGIDTKTASWPVVRHGSGRTVVKVPKAAGALTVGGHPVTVRVRKGRVVVVDPSSLRAAITGLRPGDTIYLRGGTYDGHYDDAGWNESNIVLDHGGTQAQPIALVAYPGERPKLVNTGADSGGRPNFYLSAGPGRLGSWVTIAGLTMVAEPAAIYGGGNTADSSTPESGAAHVRVVGCQMTITDAHSNTATGIVSIQGDDWQVLGNSFADPHNREIINNNHGIYIQNGADNVEIADNTLAGLHLGHTIQIHQDGDPMLYSNIWIHHNRISGERVDDQRGITVSNVADASTVVIEHNTITRVGQGFGAVTVYRGVVKILDNTIKSVDGPAIMLNGAIGGARSVRYGADKVTNADGVLVAVNGASTREAKRV